jgi:predicted ArsR family transcriptional regulator
VNERENERTDGRSDAAYHAALGSRARRQVLDALSRSGLPLDAHAIAAELGLHVTTVRFHLEHLREANLVRRAADAQKRRGRPRMLFTPVADARRDRSAQEQLIDTLATAFAHRDDDGGRMRAVEAGRSWGRALVPAASGDSEAVLVDVLDRLGFDPSRDGDVVQLRACPFRDAARRHSDVICSVHQGLVEQILGGEEGAADRSRRGRLLPFVQPELCLVDMR